MKKIMQLVILILSFNAQGEVLFRTTFSDELGGKMTVTLPSGTFDDARLNTGILYRNGKGISIVADSSADDWDPPPATEGTGALRMGRGWKDDYQVRLILPEVWDASMTYTFCIRYRAWPEAGVPAGDKVGRLRMFIGYANDETVEWVVNKNDSQVKASEWVTASLKVYSEEITAFGGKKIAIRLQDQRRDEAVLPVWIDRIEVISEPPHTLGLVL